MKKENKKEIIGLFLGSFDPPHIGHTAALVEAWKSGIFSKIAIVPAWQNPWKENKPVDFDHRFIMCSMIIPKCLSYKIYVSSVEQRIQPKYTYELLEYLKDTNSEFQIIGGTDIEENILSWTRGVWILQNFKVFPIQRLGYIDGQDIGIKVSSRYIREELKEHRCPLPYLNEDVWNYIMKEKLYGTD